MGAQPSDPVQRILFRAGMLPPPPMLALAKKGGPRDNRPVDPLTGKFLSSNPVGAADVPNGDDDDDAN